MSGPLPSPARHGAALSEHPLPTHAVGEVVGDVLEQVGAGPDVAMVWVSGGHVGAMEDIARVVAEVLGPRVLVGASAVSVVGGGREVEDSAAVALWAGRTGPVTPFRLDIGDVATGQARLPDGGPVVVLADPFSFPADRWLDRVDDQCPGVAVVGGLASAARGPGGNRLVFGGPGPGHPTVHTDGAVGFALPADGIATALVSQGCRPVGRPFVVTAADENLLLELGGRPAIERLEEMVAAADDAERARLASGLHVGVVIDEHQVDFTSGDFLVRNVLGGDRERGGLVIGDVVPVGTTVQFQVRDAVAADQDLASVLTGHRAEAALVFTCNGRGRALFDEPDHDVTAVAELTGAAAVAGMFCAGEIGPVGGRNFLHGFTASMLLFER